MNLESVLKRTDELLSLGQAVRKTVRTSTSTFGEYVDAGMFSQFRTASLSFLKNIFGPDHPYFKEFDKLENPYPSVTSMGIGILNAAKNELQGGWLFTVKGIVSAEIFSDFLEMASYLLSEGYKDPAAVMVGSVLEEHLRQLCAKNGIPIEITKDGKAVPKKADSLNSELASAGVYNKLDQKNVTAWLDLRNKAAHGKYDEYTKEQVVLMNQAVTDFMTRVAI